MSPGGSKHMSNARSPYSAKTDQKLMTEIWDPAISDNLENFVMFAYPWGKDNTPLHDKKGPRAWQRDELQAITAHIKAQEKRMKKGLPPQVYQSATASGRGIGKSALVSWIIHWMLTTRLGSTTITTANTEDQLRSKTWAELRKWHTLSINAHWFEPSAMSLKPAAWFEKSLKEQLKIDTGYYYANAQLWNEEKPDSFAGAHNHQGMLLLMDEASGIPEPIWTVSEGFFTEPILHRYWFAFSNPRRNTGAFYKCFYEFREYWRHRNIDSRTVEETDRAVYDRIIAKYGEDSDEARVEVKGMFPRQGDKQFISREVVMNAQERELPDESWAPLVMGVDPARFGDDSTVIRFRQGRDGRSYPVTRLKGLDNMQVANECARLIAKYNPDAVAIDAGNGTGIIDRLREMGYKVTEVWFGAKADEKEWANKRIELWGRMREWLKGGCIGKDKNLEDDLVGPEYTFVGQSDVMILEPKEKMKKRGLPSPDDADALACTFAVNPASRNLQASRNNPTGRGRQARDVDYNIFGGSI